MPKKAIVLRTFVASPGDVADERSLLDNVISELNRTWSGTLGIMLDVIKWETSVRPAFDSDPQAVINAQIPKDYDILIGVFWGRVGTPTPRAPSGSLEEFDLAYNRFLSTGCPEILLYFKDAPIAPSKIDIQQLQGIQEFKSSISKKGGLYSTFDDLSSFETSLRAHLSAVAQQFSVQMSSTAVISLSSAISTTNLGDEEDYGYLDYIEISAAKQTEMTEAMTVVNDATVRIGVQLNHGAAEVSAQQPTDSRITQRLVRRTAEDMNDYAGILQQQIAIITPR
ncbi:hypothetical protein [Delftia sp. RIT313]|uniref:hypothetical protein n=1 Tax=Delftia sp. RIT313 TaxID=1468410 RepID=UPI00044FC53E|nr:hypothetical protein [Delftia sp. RIT313]EZP49375.1 hypothetical protein BW39_04976 [Delftia sp. RIT313]